MPAHAHARRRTQRNSAASAVARRGFSGQTPRVRAILQRESLAREPSPQAVTARDTGTSPPAAAAEAAAEAAAAAKQNRPGTGCALQIAGPATVDHYCAAYTPNPSPNNVAANLATCGVYPAPNITLRATGQAPGQPVRWRVIQGQNRVRIIGASRGAALTLKGILASAAQNDVRIEARSGSCIATHRLSVLEPRSLVFRISGRVTRRTLVGASLRYTVHDQFNHAMGANICIDETVIECDSPYVPGVIHYNFSDHATDPRGQAVDNISVRSSRPIPPGFCVKLDQDIKAGGCGPLMHNIIVIRATGITVAPGNCRPGPNSTCP